MAEITYADGRKETIPFAALPGETGLRAPTAWESARMTGSKALEKIGMPPARAQEASELLIPGTAAEAGLQAGLSVMPVAGPLTRGVLKRAAPVAERAVRYALPAVGGAVGSLVHDATDLGKAAWETGRGALYGLAGDVLPMAGKIGAKVFGGASARAAAEGEIANMIGKAVPAFGDVKNAEDMFRLAVTSRGTKAIEKARDEGLRDVTDMLTKAPRPEPPLRVSGLPPRPVGPPELEAGPVSRTPRTPQSLRRESLKAVSEALGPTPKPPLEAPAMGPDTRHVVPPSRQQATRGVSRPDYVNVPALREIADKADFTLKEAVDLMAKLGTEGYAKSGILKEGLTPERARSIQNAARKQVVDSLEAASEGAGTLFDQTQKQYAKGLAYMDLLQHPGVIKAGTLNRNLLVEALGAKHSPGQTVAQHLESLSTPEEMAAFYDAVARGGPLSGADVAGSVGVHATTGATGPHLYLSSPHLPKFTGDTKRLPWAYRPGVPAGGTPISSGLLGLSREAADSEETMPAAK